MKAVYLHVPFCDSICAYCDFCRIITNEDTKRKWMAQIIEEIKQKNIHEADTLYFGGGTPSSLTCEQFEKIASLFNVSKEFTVECNPESLDLEKIQLYKKLGVNRISLGVQTFNDHLLKVINRKHRKEDIFQVIQLLKENGIDNISIDLMYALPEQSLEDIKKDLEIFLDLDIKHLSIYSLQIEENSVFGRQNLKPVDEDTLIPAVKIAIHNYKQREAMAKEFHKTQEALDDRKYLDRAKGLVMERNNMSE